MHNSSEHLLGFIIRSCVLIFPSKEQKHNHSECLLLIRMLSLGRDQSLPMIPFNHLAIFYALPWELKAKQYRGSLPERDFLAPFPSRVHGLYRPATVMESGPERRVTWPGNFKTQRLQPTSLFTRVVDLQILVHTKARLAKPQVLRHEVAVPAPATPPADNAARGLGPAVCWEQEAEPTNLSTSCPTWGRGWKLVHLANKKQWGTVFMKRLECVITQK